MNKLLLKAPYKIKKIFKNQFAQAKYENLLNSCKNIEKIKPVKEKPDNILYINTVANRGGAARAAYDMLCKPLKQTIITRETLGKLDKKESHLLYGLEYEKGWLDFFQLQSFKLKELEVFKKADILHFHNLHGGFFSPFALPELTKLKPTVWTLHDEQSFSGHCAYSFECEKWVSGCQNCPRLWYPPEIKVDTADFLWDTKKTIYENIDIQIVTPSEWLKNRVQKSILKNHDIRVIRNGVDEKVFYNWDKIQSRKELNLPEDKKILLFSADTSDENPQKGGKYLKQVYEHFKNRDDVLFLAIGGDKTEYITPNYLKIEYVYDTTAMAKYYAASDLFIFPTLADNLPFVILESLACGTPVISFRTGGVPEMVEHMKNGYIAGYEDVNDFVNGVKAFLDDQNLMYAAGKSGRELIEREFTLEKCLENHIKLYEKVFEKAKQ